MLRLSDAADPLGSLRGGILICRHIGCNFLKSAESDTRSLLTFVEYSWNCSYAVPSFVNLYELIFLCFHCGWVLCRIRDKCQWSLHHVSHEASLRKITSLKCARNCASALNKWLHSVGRHIIRDIWVNSICINVKIIMYIQCYCLLYST